MANKVTWSSGYTTFPYSSVRKWPGPRQCGRCNAYTELHVYINGDVYCKSCGCMLCLIGLKLRITMDSVVMVQRPFDTRIGSRQ